MVVMVTVVDGHELLGEKDHSLPLLVESSSWCQRGLYFCLRQCWRRVGGALLRCGLGARTMLVTGLEEFTKDVMLKIGHSGSLEIQLYVEVDSVTVWILAPPHDDQDSV
eukprot:5144170-Amphidinium_carterae.1